MRELTGLEICTLLSCVELFSRKKIQDTWIFWMVYVTYKFVRVFNPTWIL